jgi:hypothetical protein
MPIAQLRHPFATRAQLFESVIASEAKQSSGVEHEVSGSLRRFASRNDELDCLMLLLAL